MISVNKISLSFPTYYQKNFNFLSYFNDKRLNKTNKTLSSNYQVLKNITFQIKEGETVGVIGKNGAGKSTLLKVIAKIYEPDEGTVDVQGSLTSFLGLGTGFDNLLSGMENIYLNGFLLGLNKKQIDFKLKEIIEFADLKDHIDKPMKYYSTGMISRLSFAITLALKAEILLIDEIFSVGDIAFQQKSENAMKKKLDDASIKLIVTHNLSLVENLCTRALVLDQKKLVYDGDAKEGVKYYKSLFTEGKQK